MAQAEPTKRRFDLETTDMTAVHWMAIGLSAITGVVHLYLFVTQEFLPFLFAGLGFFGAIALILVGFHRRLVYLAGVPYVLAQMVGWYVLDGTVTALAVFDKLVQVALIALLVYLYRMESADRPESDVDLVT